MLHESLAAPARASSSSFAESALVHRAAFVALAALAVLPFWMGEYPPMTDLPQHAAQLSINQRWNDPSFGYQDTYTVNWLTTQLLAYTLVRGFLFFLPLLPAIKCVLSLAVVSLVLAVAVLLRTVRADRWWVLLTFPVGFSFSLYWGFFNYITTLPVAVLLIASACHYAQHPSKRWAVLLCLHAHFLFFSHALLLAYAGLVSAALILLSAPSRKDVARGWLALAAVLPTVAMWWLVIQDTAPSTSATPDVYQWGLFRFREFFSLQIGNEEDSIENALRGAVLLALPFVLGARPSRSLTRWVPFAITVGFFFGLPVNGAEVELIYERFAVFALPTLLFALEVRPVRGLAWRRALAVGLVAFQLTGVVREFHAFGAETASLDEVIAQAEPHKRMLYIPADGGSQVAQGVPYTHFGQWYQVKQGGLVDFSFAEYFIMWYRYRESFVTDLPTNFDSRTPLFRWDEHAEGRFDYVLVRGAVDPAWFAGSDEHWTTVTKRDAWTLLGAVKR